MADESLLTRLAGCELAQVWFVRDYLTLIFEGNPNHWSWQCYAWPVVNRDGQEFGHEDEGYRDALCSFIGSTVTIGGESAASGLSVSFGSGSVVLNPAGHEIAGPEIAMLAADQRGEWTVWRPGEDTFRHIR